jgi:hypothetical protein
MFLAQYEHLEDLQWHEDQMIPPCYSYPIGEILELVPRLHEVLHPI